MNSMNGWVSWWTNMRICIIEFKRRLDICCCYSTYWRRQVKRKGVNNLTKSSNQEHRTKVETNSGTTGGSDETGIFL